MDGSIEFDREVVTGCPAEEEMATDAAASRRFIEVGGIAMDVEDHVGCSEANGGIWVSGTVVEELCNRKVGALGGTRLFVGNGAEGHEDGDINTAGIVEDGADNLLDTSDTGVAEGR